MKSIFEYGRGENGDSTGLHPYALWHGELHSGQPCSCLADIPNQGWDEFRTNYLSSSFDLRGGGEVGPDGKYGWHVFRMDWHTSPVRKIEYWIDNMRVYSSSSDPTYYYPNSDNPTSSGTRHA